MERRVRRVRENRWKEGERVEERGPVEKAEGRETSAGGWRGG